MQLIKNFLIIAADFLKKSLLLCNLDSKESKGYISLVSMIRFLPFTRVVVPFSLGRTIRGTSFNANFTEDPYGKLCMDIFKGEDDKVIFENLLNAFKIEKDLNASDIVKLKNHNLMNYPAWAVVMPWEKQSIKEKFENYPHTFYKNRSNNNLIFDDNSRLSIIETMYSSESIKSKINQMKKLYLSIKNNGLKKNNDLPKINIMIDSNEWRWFMGDAGNHRSYICACCDYKLFEGRIASIINKNKISSWPNVKNGTYSIKDAEKIFDNYFDGSNVLRGVV